MQRSYAGSSSSKYFNYIKSYGLISTCNVKRLFEEYQEHNAVPLSWTTISCATRRANQNLNLDQDRRECICLASHKSYPLDKAMALLSRIPELTAEQDDLYFFCIDYLKSIENRKLFRHVAEHRLLQYLKRTYNNCCLYMS